MALPVYPTAHRFAGCARLNIVVVASSSSSSSPSYTRNLGAFADCTIVSLDDGLGVSGMSERVSQTGSAPRQSTTDRLFPDGDVYKTDTRRSGQVDITGTSMPSADRRSRSFASSANPTL